MMPNTPDIVTDIDNDAKLDTDQYSFLLGIKEFSFLVLILFIGCSGFSFCVKKIYEPKASQKIDNIITHDLELAEIDMPVQNPSLSPDN
ncbi:MAG: hypothetical protein KJN84_12325 [Bacteroidia bacterium]|nr:hypothetical protein [Bacteroidia bacterium]